PNYVVMKLFRDNYAPNLLKTDGPDTPLNVVATRSEDQRTIYLKVVNPEKSPVETRIMLDGAFTPAAASMQLVAPGSETIKNTLDRPELINPEPAAVQVNGKTLQFTLPPLSVGVVKVQ